MENRQRLLKIWRELPAFYVSFPMRQRYLTLGYGCKDGLTVQVQAPSNRCRK